MYRNPHSPTRPFEMLLDRQMASFSNYVCINQNMKY
jgi:hypothetical protein